MYKVGIVGSEGYAVGELYNLLINHPDVHVEMIYSPLRAGMSVAELFNDLNSMRVLHFTDRLELEGLDVLFLCLQSAASREFLHLFDIPEGLKIIDFSQEFRHTKFEETGFVYGLSEGNRRAIINATRVSVPGAFAAAIQTPLMPLAKHLLLNSEIHVTAVAGKTEALARPKPEVGITYDMLFDNFHVFRPLEHHHIGEVRRTLREFQNSFDSEIILIPMRGNFTRGVYTTMYLDCPLEIEEIRKLYEEYFDDHSFVHLVDEYPDVRDTVNTNELHIHLSKHGNRLLIVSTMDNLMKGAAGSAIHIMNLMLKLVETTGLNVKPSVF
ncbi:MAG: hypothetical protein PUK66_04930 [Bacteroidales bacterium]|uniref:hypothetical protein n=1 Tax=Porphyromonas sp. TaxID=1924944 RepID=UPI002975473B|nr:hypothetical protein [Porphyromonas sp.]MDD7438168.1 hypothetical protein [Bacteroidales bacterium]MDY3066815.1 hypothetical protein [Porphyromonas sp.]